MTTTSAPSCWARTGRWRAWPRVRSSSITPRFPQIVTRELAFQACEAEKGIGWVDAPVSGGQAGAENGQLVVMCGGTEAISPPPSR
jgi:3-hydroxyisobutyrate dehydrogenase-like beta-hydroxyacid dehydrogenase